MSRHTIANRALELGLSVLLEDKRWMADGGDGHTNSYVSRENAAPAHHTYLIHDNGGRPWQVVADPHCLTVFHGAPKYATVTHRVSGYAGHWAGFDTSGLFAHGNTVLVSLTNPKLGGDWRYLYIQRDLIEFQTDEPITDYVSRMGNNDVPYPLAFSRNFVYFLTDYTKVCREDLKTRGVMRNARKLYDEYYGNNPFTAPKRTPLVTRLVDPCGLPER